METFDDAVIERGLGRLAKARIGEADYGLTSSERRIIGILSKVCRLLDNVYREQVAPGAASVMEELEAHEDELSRRRREFISWNKGFWDKLDGDKPFYGKAEPKPGAAFYPEDAAKQDMEALFSDRELGSEAKSCCTIITKKDGRLIPVKYSEVYGKTLAEASRLVSEAAALAENGSLRSYLEKTALALVTNDYTEQQIAWLHLDSNIDPVIGPYETYEDKLFGLKAAFEAYVNIKDEKESSKLSLYSNYLKEIDDSIPISGSKGFSRKSQSFSPIAVVNEIFYGGEANAGYATSAYNLPNDESIRRKHGSKKVLLKNIMDIKFEKIAMPIARELLLPEQLGMMDADAGFKFVLFHELSHGLGPGEVPENDGTMVAVSEKLRDLFSHLEEARADVTGVYCGIYLSNKGVLGEGFKKKLYVSYLVYNLLKGMRAGLNEAHAKGQSIQYNYLSKRGAIGFDGERFSVDFSRFEEAMLSLISELNGIQADGDYERARKFSEAYAFLPEEVKNANSRIGHIPVDIIPEPVMQ